MDKDKLFEEVYTKYYRYPFRFFYKYFSYSRQYNAEELVADFWAYFYEVISDYRAENGAKITTFMYSCCNNYMSNRRTRENAIKRKALITYLDANPILGKNIALDGKGALDKLITKERSEFVQDALSRLSEKHRSMLNDVIIEGEKIKEAGKKVGLERNMASKTYKKAQTRFANLTRRYYVSEG